MRLPLLVSSSAVSGHAASLWDTESQSPCALGTVWQSPCVVGHSMSVTMRARAQREAPLQMWLPWLGYVVCGSASFKLAGQAFVSDWAILEVTALHYPSLTVRGSA